MNTIIPSSKIFHVDNTDFDLEELSRSIENKTTIVLHEETLNDQANDLLEKILGAIKVDLSKEVLMLQLKKTDQLHLGKILRNNNIRLILNFACNAKQLKLNIQNNKYQVLHLGVTKYIHSDHINALEKNKQLKMLLWNALKTCAFK